MSAAVSPAAAKVNHLLIPDFKKGPVQLPKDEEASTKANEEPLVKRIDGTCRNDP